ncbi:hypothetical protein MIR68_000927 [Amoeboaphelidium protococcarum]|nr:hypothetical protein MIR68_000927 [Amoeboaphelidium protococcarum]
MNNLPPNSIQVEDKVAKQIIRHVNALLLGLNENDNRDQRLRKFPGAQPISFLQAHLQSLQHEDYYVCEKSDGVRYLMYIVQNFVQNEEFPQGVIRQDVYLLDRKMQVYGLAGLVFPSHDSQPNKLLLINETLLDGELVQHEIDGEAVYKYLAFDCVMYNTKVLAQRPLSTRLGYLKDFVLRPYQKYQKDHMKSPHQSLQLEAKQMFFAYDIPSVMKQIESGLGHENDGLIFTNVNAPYTIGRTCDGMLKWKPADQNSIDFKLRLSFDRVQKKPLWKLDILSHNGDGYEEYGELLLDPEEDRELIKQFKQDSPDGRIVECRVIVDGETREKKWKFMRFRDDKTTPNHISIVPRIMKSIDESVSIESLSNSQFMDKVRRNWKRRQESKGAGQHDVKTRVQLKRKHTNDNE